MKISETKLEGCLIIEPSVFNDSRGYFYESFNQKAFSKATGHTTPFVQDNISHSKKGVLRGLHYQLGEFSQSKLVSVLMGTAMDIVVDIRQHSPTFKQHISFELSESNKKQLFIPRGFAHGFVVLSDKAIFSYKCDNYYSKEHEQGVIYDDPELNIDWKLPKAEIILSEKDMQLPTLKNAIL